MKLQHESIARELELHPRCFPREAVVPNQGERDERGTSQADLEHVRQDADFILVFARLEFIKYPVRGFYFYFLCCEGLFICEFYFCEASFP